MHILIRDKEQIRQVDIDYTKPIFCDTETCIDEGKSSGGLYGQVRLIQVYQEGWPGAFIFDCFFVDLYEVLDLLVPGHLVFHNSSYDLHTINLHTPQLWMPIEISDTVYLSRLTYYTEKQFGYYKCLKHAGLFTEELQGIDKTSNQKFDWGGVLPKDQLKYAEHDVVYLQKLYEEVKGAESKESYKIDIANLRYALEYDRRGIPVNQKSIQEQMKTCTVRLEKLLEELPVNPNSPKQVCKLLRTNKSDRDTLMKLYLEGNQMAGDIREARLLSKERMYLRKYDRPLIYGFHNPCGAITGRFSCTGGHRFDHSNVQQIPRRILPCLEAPEGWTFVYSDYSGLELRMAVVWTAEPTMDRLMRAGVDLHTYTGCIIYDLKKEDLTKHQRMIGKILNFTLVYGAGVITVQSMLRAWGDILMPLDEVKVLRNKWLQEYEYFDAWHNMNKNHMAVYGYLDVSTALGRKVRTYTVPDALNTPIQGSSAEVTKVSLMYLKDRYPNENLINTIHDSNCLLVRENEADRWIERLDKCMVDAWFYVTKNLATPDLPMPTSAEANTKWEF